MVVAEIDQDLQSPYAAEINIEIERFVAAVNQFLEERTLLAEYDKPDAAIGSITVIHTDRG